MEQEIGAERHPNNTMKINIKHAQHLPDSGYSVQFVLPVDNPVNKVRRKVLGKFIRFEVPLNHPDINRLTYSDLVIQSLANAEDRAKKIADLALSTPLNNTAGSSERIQS